MFTTNDIIYYTLIALCIVLSFLASAKNLPGLYYLRALLVTAFCLEMMNEFVDFHYPRYTNVIYQFYIPFEFVMLACFFYQNYNNKRFRRLIALIIPLFVLFSLCYSFFISSLTIYPSIPYNIDITIIALVQVFTLFNLPVNEKIKITDLPIFWIILGLLLFYMGILFYNGANNYLLRTNIKLAQKLRILVNVNLNYLLYLFWAYGFICSIRLKKYFIQ